MPEDVSRRHEEKTAIQTTESAMY